MIYPFSVAATTPLNTFQGVVEALGLLASWTDLTGCDVPPGQGISMSVITLRILDGADRGKVYENIAVPVTIGREEGNSIQLNDERISRFHLKIQQDHSDIVLTDLESTNGCKVNNEEVQLRILRHGDLITVGRSTLLFGTRQQINHRLKSLKSGEKNGGKQAEPAAKKPSASSSKELLRDDWKENPNYQLELLDLDPPKLPDRLSPGQAAKLSEAIEYLHMHMRCIINGADVDSRKQQAEISMGQWQRLLDLQARLAEYLRGINTSP